MKPFRVYRNVVPHADIESLAALLAHAMPDHPGQNGTCLAQFPDLATHLTALIAHVRKRFWFRKPVLRLESSSLRVQAPTPTGLALHHDAHLVPNLACVAWLPLTPIDGFTPTLECSSVKLKKQLAHGGDANGYSVAKLDREYPLACIEPLFLGDMVLLAPLCLHRTCVKPWHIRTRRSLDLRFQLP